MLNLKGTLCAVTGGAGFIGSNISIALLERGANVRILDNLATGRKSNLDPHHSEIDFVELDIRDLEAVRKAMKKVDYVFHEAAINSVPRSIDHPDLSVSTNVMGTLNLLMASKESEVKKFIYASSSSAYGGVKEEMKTETMPAIPLSPYAISKYSAEQLTQNYFEVFGLPTVSLRYFNVFGPRQNPNSHYAAVIPKFLNALIGGEPPVVFGDGTQARDFTFVRNVVEANLLALERGKPGAVYNIGCGGLITLKEILERLYKIVGKRIEPLYKDWRAGDVYRSGGDISRATADLGYKPSVGLDEGLEKMVAWFREKEIVPT